MPDLYQTLRSTDLDFLQRIARIWKIELTSKSFTAALKEMEAAMGQESSFHETVELLSEEAQTAWSTLLARQGRESWAVFTREFGELRTFGLARRTRENPDLRPVSPVEMLWYCGLIGRAFLKITGEPQEYVYIPDEFLNMSSLPISEKNPLIPRPATTAESKVQILASDSILDDATELLAALRMNRPLENIFPPQKVAYIQFLLALLSQMALITANHLPEPEKVKTFLSADRGEALLTLFMAWSQSKELNDLHMLPGLVCEGNWTNDPTLPRELLINLIKELGTSNWWSMSSLLNQLKTKAPDFQRPAGDYDSWFIREEKTHLALRGFASWDKVDGALIRYLIGGPLHWLGVVDVARADKSTPPLSFRISQNGVRLLQGLPSSDHSSENGTATVSADGTLFVTPGVARSIIYQLARFCEPVAGNKSERKFRITARSLNLASDQGLRPSQLLQLLQQAKVKNIPQSISEALDRWEKYGAEIKLESSILLHLDKPDLLPLLQKTPRISRCLGEVLNSKTVTVKIGSVESLRQALAEMGLLAEIRLDKDV
jgi:hypothetical protein